MTDAWHTEVIELHEFFQDWFRGELEDTDEEFQRLEDALAEEFELVSPDGSAWPREELTASLRGLHGAHADEQPPYRIWIEDVRVRELADDLRLVSYVEWQASQGLRTARASSALLRRDESASGVITWLHVHESWRRPPL